MPRMSKIRTKQRKRFDEEQARRGRLTEEERERLAALREEPEPRPLPGDADRWSTWDTGERGPLPRPGWVVTELAAVDHELGILKTGKEADVHLLRRSLPGGGMPSAEKSRGEKSCLLAAKRYRHSDHRMFHRDAGYLEGRRMRRTRENRAMARRSALGRGLIAEQWAVAEFRVLSALWNAGAPVPYPVQRVGTEVLLEFVGTPRGEAAPRLASLRPDREQLTDLWHQLVDALLALAEQGYTHGDLSAYNVLVEPESGGAGRLVLIDLPQAVDLAANPLGATYLRRDVDNITGWFRDRGAPGDQVDPDELCTALAEAARMA
ncbi:serine protein kinase RIO [Saccharopolyspora erythraea]|uniref:non-specific serine/threonine protein kinase n=2 Tax=Saccharopolyspora erythraea TaxID=1836 RepID=A4FM49_SACEN|nr:RIO1 family regulatory kinase/ATPase [Saccharopolyspora erythraea]QRK93906.1 kinase [Saccharopolyspora erythraea]CAM05124.1 RIO-type serine/threonine protein kinase [Saccharopolyspora erythraea NRRL 2338]